MEGSDVSENVLACMVVRQVRTLDYEFVTRGTYFPRKEFAADFGFLLTPIERDGQEMNTYFMPWPEYTSNIAECTQPEERNGP
jgi:hypothetical protein